MKLQEKLAGRLARLEWTMAGLSGKRPRPFILLSSQRCGNNMLRSALEKHPDLYFETEVFLFAHRPESHGLVPENFIPMIQDTPVKACVKLFKVGMGKKAAGFTFFYDQMLEDNQTQLWRFLEDMSGLHVIELRRRNLFLQWLSFREALANDQWVLYAGDERAAPQSVHLNAWEYDEWFREYTENRSAALMHLERHPRLEIFYEDLQTDFFAQTDGVLEFLGATPMHMETMTRKIAVRSLASRIENYEQFVNEIKGIEGEQFFHDAVRLENESVPAGG